MTDTIILPGLIDIHVHLPDPGQTHKEDFLTGTSAALAGGFTSVFDMPNNADPIINAQRLNAKIESAKNQIVSNVGFYFGTLGDNFDVFPEVIDDVCGLKVYMNMTTGGYKIDADRLIEIYKAWPSDKPILLHAEDDVSEIVLAVLKEIPKRTHICHVSSQEELTFVMKAKDKGLPITCGVTPHHLFLSDKDAEVLGAYGHMKPLLKPEKHQNFIWDNLDAVDVIESDHAPHTREEKAADVPPFGVPGLETTLPLLLTAYADDNLSLEKLTSLLHQKPREILGLPIVDDVNDSTPQDRVEIIMKQRTITNESLHTKAGWSPFAGRQVVGEVSNVYRGDELVFSDGKVLANPGSGSIIATDV